MPRHASTHKRRSTALEVPRLDLLRLHRLLSEASALGLASLEGEPPSVPRHEKGGGLGGEGPDTGACCPRTGQTLDSTQPTRRRRLRLGPSLSSLRASLPRDESYFFLANTADNTANSANRAKHTTNPTIVGGGEFIPRFMACCTCGSTHDIMSRQPANRQRERSAPRTPQPHRPHPHQPHANQRTPHTRNSQ